MECMNDVAKGRKNQHVIMMYLPSLFDQKVTFILWLEKIGQEF